MYDESIDVVNAREIPSPSNSNHSGPDSSPQKIQKMPRRPGSSAARQATTTAAQLDTESESDSDIEKYLKDHASKDSNQAGHNARMVSHKTTASRRVAAPSAEERKSDGKSNAIESSDNSDSDSAGYSSGAARRGGRGGGGVVVPPGAYDPKKFADLKVSPEVDNLFQYIQKYTPQKIEIEYRLQPFLPDYVPSVGDIDAFIKVTTPARGVRGDLSDAVREKIDAFGLTVLDEPAAQQSDSALLHLQFRALSKTSSAKSNLIPKKIENAHKNPKAIQQWIRDVGELHLSKPAPTVTYSTPMPDIESLMQEWPHGVEQTLNETGFPPSQLDCQLAEYVDIVCSLFDIPVADDSLNSRVQALHVLFSLYDAVRHSQLYADREKETAEVTRVD